MLKLWICHSLLMGINKLVGLLKINNNLFNCLEEDNSMTM